MFSVNELTPVFRLDTIESALEIGKDQTWEMHSINDCFPKEMVMNQEYQDCDDDHQRCDRHDRKS